jgi:hypothetical protein
MIPAEYPRSLHDNAPNPVAEFGWHDKHDNEPQE